jgi:hypothetical protein
MKRHWHLGYIKKTACGIVSYETDMDTEFETRDGGRIKCALTTKATTCKNCRKVMDMDDHTRAFSKQLTD